MRDNYDKWGQSKIEFFNFNYNLNHYLENNFTLTLIILIILRRKIFQGHCLQADL